MNKEIRNKRRELGLCTECGKNKPESGSPKCLLCLKKCNEIKARHMKKNKQKGLCFCGREVKSGGRCEKHLEFHKIHSRKLRNKRKENNLCIRCGKPLLERPEVTKCINCMEQIDNFNWK